MNSGVLLAPLRPGSPVDVEAVEAVDSLLHWGDSLAAEDGSTAVPGGTVQQSSSVASGPGDSVDPKCEIAPRRPGDAVDDEWETEQEPAEAGSSHCPGESVDGEEDDETFSNLASLLDSRLAGEIDDVDASHPLTFDETTLSERESKKRVRKHRNRRKKVKLSEPVVAPSPLTVEVLLDSEKGVALTDSGSQADVISSEFALRNGFELRRLLAPVHADLGADGHSVRLALYTAVPCSVGPVEYATRSFFVAPLPAGIDAILGVPWLRDSKVGISSSKMFFVPDGPNEDFYDFETGRFALQPQRNLDDLGFVQRPMSVGEQNAFFLCALAAGVPGLEDVVEYEPHNPLLDEWEDDPSKPDLSEEEAAEQLSELRSRFSDVFVKDLPDCLPPFRPINHDIHEIVEGMKIPPRVIGMPDRYAKQWTAHLLKFVETGYWSPKALDSACSMFAVPKHDPSQARFVINLKPRNANTVRTASPIPDMRTVRANLASHPIRSTLDFKKAYEQIRLNPDSVPRSGFVTKNGTFVSRVMQQGDCNAPDTMHRVCYMMFSKAMGRFLDTFYDDVFIYSHTRRAHLRYLEIVFTTLRHYKFYLADDKVDLMSSRMEALGAIVERRD